eukprot:1182904-Prorocentrum_minimum.AAC.2
MRSVVKTAIIITCGANISMRSVVKTAIIITCGVNISMRSVVKTAIITTCGVNISMRSVVKTAVIITCGVNISMRSVVKTAIIITCGRRCPGASAPTTDCEAGRTVTKGGYRVRLIAPVTINGDTQKPWELGSVRHDDEAPAVLWARPVGAQDVSIVGERRTPVMNCGTTDGQDRLPWGALNEMHSRGQAV